MALKHILKNLITTTHRTITKQNMILCGVLSLVFLFALLGLQSKCYAINEYEFKNIAYNYIKNNTNYTEEEVITSINNNMPSELNRYLNDNYNILILGTTSALNYYIMPLNYSQKIWIRQGYSIIHGISCFARGSIAKTISHGNVNLVEFDQLTIMAQPSFNETEYITPFDIYRGRNESGASLWASAGDYSPRYLTTDGPFESTPPTYFMITEGPQLTPGYTLTDQSYISGDNIYLAQPNQNNFWQVFTESQLTELKEIQKYVYYYNIYQGHWMLSLSESKTLKNFSGDEYKDEYLTDYTENIITYYEYKNNLDRFIIYILVPKNEITFNNIVLPVYYKTDFTRINGTIISTKDTFSGDYLTIYNDNTNNKDLVDQQKENDDFWKQTYNNLFTLSSGETKQEIEQIYAALNIGSGEEQKDAVMQVVNILDGNADDFIISWPNIYIPNLYDNPQVLLISGDSINFSKICRENEALGNVKGTINIIISTIMLFYLMFNYANTILNIFGTEITFLKDPEIMIEIADVSTDTTTYTRMPVHNNLPVAEINNHAGHWNRWTSRRE